MGRTDCVELLIAKGADVNAVDYDGRTPAALAENRGHTALADLIRKHASKPGR